MDGLWLENLIIMDDLGVPLFSETPISSLQHQNSVELRCWRLSRCVLWDVFFRPCYGTERRVRRLTSQGNQTGTWGVDRLCWTSFLNEDPCHSMAFISGHVCLNLICRELLQKTWRIMLRLSESAPSRILQPQDNEGIMFQNFKGECGAEASGAWS